MFISNLVLLMASAAQDGNVTVDLAPQSLDVLMPKLAKATGQNLSVGTLMTKDVLLVNVKNAPVNELVATIAKVTGGIWVQSGGGLRLDKDLALESKENAEAVAERAVFLKASIDKLVQDAAKEPKFDPSQLRQQVEQMRSQGPGQAGGPGGNRGGLNFQNMQMQMPAGRAIIQTLASMRPEDLAKIGPNQRVVFSSRPTSMQKPLPGNAVAVMSSFMADQQKLTAAMGQMREEFRAQRGDQPGGQARPPQPNQQQTQQLAPVKSFLIASRNGNQPGLALVYVAADANGQAVGTGNLMLGQAFNGPFDPAVQQQQQQQASSGDGESVWSAKTLAAADLFGRGNFGGPGGPRGGGFGGGNQSDQTPPSKEFIALLKDPVTNDPLSFHVADAVRSMAGDKNVVALLPDSLAGQVGRALRSKPTVEAVTSLAKDSWNLSLEVNGNWFTLSPKRKIDARYDRVDRVALKTLIDSIVAKKSARLDDVAKYAMKAPAVNNGLDLALVRAIDPGSVQTVQQVYGQDRDALLFFAGLNPVNRTNMANGQKLIVSTIGGNVQAILANMVYHSQDGPAVVRNVNAVQAQPGFAGRGPGGRGRNGVGNMSNERTEVLPTGVPGNSIVAMLVASTPVAKAVNSSGQARVYDPQMMAGERAMAEAPVPQPQGNQNRPRPQTPNWQGYVPGVQTSYTMVFELAPGITMTRRLEDTSFDGNAQAVSYDSLPGSFQNAVDERYKVMKDRMTERQSNPNQGQRGGRRGGGQRRGAGEGPPPGP